MRVVGTTILQGDCLEVLRDLPDESVHCVVTSPPYWGLRDYGTAKWEGGDPKCDHRSPTMREGRNEDRAKLSGSAATNNYQLKLAASVGICGRCGAKRTDSQIGLEYHWQDHVDAMVRVFREVRRVLRKDGTLWLNYGDCYATAPNGRSAAATKAAGNDDRTFRDKPYGTVVGGLKAKDLVGMPWRVALALQADGWWLRQDIIWHKPNPMPESVRDRCTKAHEYLFMFAKSERYYFDGEAIREPAVTTNKKRWTDRGYDKQRGHVRRHAGFNGRYAEKILKEGVPSTRSRRSVWTVATRPFKEAHFATFPPDLIEPCIKAGTSEKGCCSACGAPWKRETATSYENPGNRLTNGPLSIENRHMTAGFSQRLEKRVETLGWQPTCTCNAPAASCVVLDPFGGAGTTGLVANRLGREAILIDLNPSYCEMAARRIESDQAAQLGWLFS